MKEDFRYAVRMLAQKPAFTLVLIFALALGIGANSAIFSVVDAVLFRSLPVDRPERLVRVFAVEERFENSTSSYPVYEDYRDQANLFSGLAAYADFNPVHLSAAFGKPERVMSALVTGNYFQVLGVKPLSGRLILPSDDRGATNNVVVISYRLWRKFFASDQKIIGATVNINLHPFVVIGITKSDFFGIGLGSFPDLWVPISSISQTLPEFSDLFHSRQFSWLDIVGRMKPGVSTAQAQTQLDVIAKRRAVSQKADEKDPLARVVSANTASLDSSRREELSRISWLLLIAVILLLLISCSVAGGLLLVRAESRNREIAIRKAVGASSYRIVRQLIMESLLLSLLGAIAGLLLASWLIDLLPTTISQNAPFPLEASHGILDLRVIVFTIVVSVFSGLLFGAAPGLHLAKAEVVPVLKDETLFRRFRRLNLRNGFVVLQISLSVILLIASGLLLRTLWKANEISAGFNPDQAIMASVDLSRQGYSHESGSEAFTRLLNELKRVPAFRSVALARTIPVQDSGMLVSLKFGPNGQIMGSGPQANVDLNIISQGYFQTLGVPLLAGRDFTRFDTNQAPMVAIINETMARKFWPKKNAVGQFIKGFGRGNRTVEIIGVARDMKIHDLRELPPPVIYVPLSQSYMPGMTILIRTSLPAGAAFSSLRTAMNAVDKELPIFQLATLREHLGATLMQQRVLAWLLSGFAGIAVLLALAGLYSLIAYTSAMRTCEFGIRLAIGAQRSDVMKLVLSQGAALAFIGLGLGTLVALLLTRLLSNLLFGVSPTDPLTFCTIIILMTLVCMVASYFPARRATRVDPVEALRYE